MVAARLYEHDMMTSPLAMLWLLWTEPRHPRVARAAQEQPRAGAPAMQREGYLQSQGRAETLAAFPTFELERPWLRNLGQTAESVRVPSGP